MKYSLFNGDGITIEWEDTQGGPHETKLSWPQAAGIVQRLVDEGRYLEAPAASEPEQKDETQPFSAEYRLLDRLCADCEYFLGEGQRAEKHLWAGSVEAQIAKMRELYAQLPENRIGSPRKPSTLTPAAWQPRSSQRKPGYWMKRWAPTAVRLIGSCKPSVGN